MDQLERYKLRNQLSIIKSMLREMDFCVEQAQTTIYNIENKMMDEEDAWQQIGFPQVMEV